MSMLLGRLKDYCADIDGSIGRFLDDEELFTVCFAEFMNVPCFVQLKSAPDAHDYDAAFDAAKGVAGSIGLSSTYRAAYAPVKPLRAKQVFGLQSLYKEITGQYETSKQTECREGSCKDETI